jgi:endonuclease/exonuclease/phosphatase family metal-dependent hydrolase
MMRSNFSKFFKMIISIVVAAFSIIGLMLLLLTITEFKPDNVEDLQPSGFGFAETIDRTGLSLMIWNIGYSGLGREMDFFYDGGKMVRPEEKIFLDYQNGMINFVESKNDVDFILLQEVDQSSKRSRFFDQTILIDRTLSEHTSVFAKNYNAPFVPLPVSKPLGKVVSGLMSFSVFQPVVSKRIAFEGNFPWPKRLFMLKRGFIMQHFATDFDRELVIINTHNSAFDDGQLRERQIKSLRTYAQKEYEKGNFVVVAGDWNMNPPGFSAQQISNGDLGAGNSLGNIPKTFMPEEWQWVFDKQIPTNRYLDIPYIKGKTQTTVIDFFLVSPNVFIEKVETVDLGFGYSDHNPVIMKIILKR